MNSTLKLTMSFALMAMSLYLITAFVMMDILWVVSNEDFSSMTVRELRGVYALTVVTLWLPMFFWEPLPERQNTEGGY